MQRVRQEELALGKKRQRSSRVPIRSTSSDSDSSALSDPSSSSSQSGYLNPSSGALESSKTSFPLHRHLLKKIPLNVAPAVNDFDPFGSLPAHGLPRQSVESLLRHCFDVLLPMTFAMESTSHGERIARQGMVLRQKSSSPAVFLGFMGTVAAHRAIVRGHHKDLAPSETNHDDLITDPEYKQVKHHTIVAVREMIEDRRSPNQHLVDACYGLVSVATIVGNFSEAKVHLQGIRHLMSVAGISEESVAWLPITNVKLATAMLSQPLLPIPWERHPIPQDILRMVSSPPEVEQNRLGTSFTQTPALSDRLKELLSCQRDICNMCNFNAHYPGTLPASGHFVLNQKGTELEYDLVVYPYETATFERDQSDEPVVPVLEGVVRLAALGILTTTPHSIHPSSGSGRAVTHHQKRAFQKWSRQRHGDCSRAELQLVLWALFVFAQCAGDTPEIDLFTRHIAQLARELWLLRWQDVELIIYGFLYIPCIQAKMWKDIYNSAMSLPWSELALQEVTLTTRALPQLESTITTEQKRHLSAIHRKPD